MRGFGQVLTGASVAEAVVRSVFLERMATVALRAAPAGGATPFDQAQVDAFMSRPGPRAEQVARLWTYLAARHHPERPAGELAAV
jgi:ribulose-5-phosphate 4-epimerase/fuculose-1-phosphate aldolase